MSAAPATRRGAFLLLIGSIYAVIGFAYATTAVTPRDSSVYAMALSLAPMNVWGIVWCVCGVVAAVTGWWPPGRDRLGFMVLGAWSSLWAVLAACSALFLGSERGWIAALIWAAFTGAVLIVSGMENPHDRR